MSSMTADRAPARAVPALPLIIIAVVGLGVGVATSYLQGVLPDSANFLANSGAVWTVITFLLALSAATALRVGAAAGLLGLLGEVLGYYAIAGPLRHIPTSSTERMLWVVAAFVVGPIAGVAAFYARRGQPRQRVAAAAAVCGIVAGEGAYALVRLAHPTQGWTELGLAVSAVGVVAVTLGRSWSDRAVGLGAATIAAVLVFGAYVAV